MKTKKTGKSYVKPFLIGTAIFTVLVLHFAVSQFIALDGEADASVSELTEKQAVVIEPQIENKSAETINEAKIAVPIERREPKIEPSRTVETETATKKKAPRESRAERLRRAEKILTGV